MLVHGGDPIIAWGKFLGDRRPDRLRDVDGDRHRDPVAAREAHHGALGNERTDASETVAAIRRILLIARFDVAILRIVVADMITKPFS